MARMSSKKLEKIVWHACHCGCHGWETIYKGRLFWLGNGPKGYWLFGGPRAHTGHSFYRGGSAAFHVGKFDCVSKRDAANEVRKHYKEYERVPRLNWHKCPCGNGPQHETACLKGRRFYIRWNSFYRRYALMQGHAFSKKYDYKYRNSEIDGVVREMARNIGKKRIPEEDRESTAQKAHRAHVFQAHLNSTPML
jgi:hypothetical protein